MTNQDHGSADFFLDAIDGLHDLALRDHVKCTGWLVGDDDLWFEQDADGNTDALLHATAQLMGIHGEYVAFEINRLKRLHTALGHFFFAHVRHMGTDGIHHLGTDTHHRIERVHRSLRDIGNAAKA